MWDLLRARTVLLEPQFQTFRIAAAVRDIAKMRKVHPSAPKQPKKTKKAAAPKDYSSLAQHQQIGKKLLPPLANLPLQTNSWVNDRLPEMIWAALLIVALGRDEALSAFRVVLSRCQSVLQKTDQAAEPREITLSGIADMPDEIRLEILHTLADVLGARESLRPLLLLHDLPAREDWETAIEATPNADDWDQLKAAVAVTMNHQSQEATDCRWVKVAFMVLTGRMIMPQHMVKEIVGYPNWEDQRKVRPLIRSVEVGLGGDPLEIKTDWPKQFWLQCFRDSRCDIQSIPQPGTSEVQVGTTRDIVCTVRRELADHYYGTITTTGVDPRHEGAFGLAAYALALLEEGDSRDR